MFGLKQEQVEYPVLIWQRLWRISSFVAGFQRWACGAQLGCDQTGLLSSNVGDELAAATSAAKLFWVNVEAPEDLEGGLLPLAQLVPKVGDGNQSFGHDLWPRSLI